MATPIFDQRPKQFLSFGYPFSKFVQDLELQGFRDGAVVTATLLAFNADGVPKNRVDDDLQPDITVVDAKNRRLVLEAVQTGGLSDVAGYWLEYRVDDTVHGGTLLKITRELPSDAEALLVAEKIQISAGIGKKILLRNPDVELGVPFVFSPADPAVNGRHLPHSLNTQFLTVKAWGANKRPRTDVQVVALQDQVGKDPQNWGYLVLPATLDADDALTTLVVEPTYI